MAQNLDLITPFTKVKLQTQTSDGERAIGIFWGAFNPVHIAHLTIADQVRQQLHLEKVLLMPESDGESGHIATMLALALTGKEGLLLDTCRCAKREKTMLDTVRELKKLNPERMIYFIIGGDMVSGLAQWDGIDELLELVQFVGVQRPGVRAGTSYPILWVDVPQMAISSTLIREQISKGLKPHFLVAPKVLTYILKEKLYVKNR
ncbi:MAG: nicotinate-nicotinamide nucleotide adenylyltransferase [Streptococcaceae bacterium]|jgi:nicotinate-nucleotide adenylyltransferase|nr:nicotinate-nicotinamide nucleotide adenylyltransferase [Streptococcaceae bacterium]